MSFPAPARPSGPAFPVFALAASHERLRLHCDLLDDLAALPDLRDPRAPGMAANALHFFRNELPLHVAAEDRSLAPRLRRAVPGSARLLDELARDHADVDACIWVLLAHLGPLAAGRPIPSATFRASVRMLRSRLLPRMEREEQELFPLCEALSLADRVAIARELTLSTDSIIR